MILSISYPILLPIFDRFYHLGSMIYALSMISYIILSLIIPNYIIIGSISINDNGIKVYNDNNLIKSYPVNKIKQIKFAYNNTTLDGGYGTVLGIRNFITIKDTDDNVEKFRLQIEGYSILRFIDEKLDLLGDNIEIIKIKKGFRVKRLRIK